jgi:hypothetical protein
MQHTGEPIQRLGTRTVGTDLLGGMEAYKRRQLIYDTPLTVEQILTILTATPSRLAGLTKDLAPDRLTGPPEPGEWSARDVLAHLRACSDMWGKYILLILDEDRPTFKAVNPTTWIKQTDYREQEFLPSLEAFTAQRLELLKVLEPLPTEAWSREATVTGAGKPRQRSVYTYAQWLANHERSHLKQVERILDTTQEQNKI